MHLIELKMSFTLNQAFIYRDIASASKKLYRLFSSPFPAGAGHGFTHEQVTEHAVADAAYVAERGPRQLGQARRRVWPLEGQVPRGRRHAARHQVKRPERRAVYEKLKLEIRRLYYCGTKRDAEGILF